MVRVKVSKDGNGLTSILDRGQFVVCSLISVYLVSTRHLLVPPFFTRTTPYKHGTSSCGPASVSLFSECVFLKSEYCLKD